MKQKDYQPTMKRMIGFLATPRKSGDVTKSGKIVPYFPSNAHFIHYLKMNSKILSVFNIVLKIEDVSGVWRGRRNNGSYATKKLKPMVHIYNEKTGLGMYLAHSGSEPGWKNFITAPR
jgi:hypothetical protein